jgi:hypothetical protein
MRTEIKVSRCDTDLKSPCFYYDDLFHPLEKLLLYLSSVNRESLRHVSPRFGPSVGELLVAHLLSFSLTLLFCRVEPQISTTYSAIYLLCNVSGPATFFHSFSNEYLES